MRPMARGWVAPVVLALAGCAAAPPMPRDRITGLAEGKRGDAATAGTDGVEAVVVAAMSDGAMHRIDRHRESP